MHRVEMDDSSLITFKFDGKTMQGRQGETVASALLHNNQRTFGTTAVTGAPRGPYCMMGLCFDCLVEIDGIANRQSCITEICEGMTIRRQTNSEEKNYNSSTASGEGK